MSPTERTLQELRKRGIPCAKVEQWNAHAKVRQDLFGIIDIIALTARGVLGIQATTMSNFSSRCDKLTGEKIEESRMWIETAGALLQVWGWRKILKKTKKSTKVARWEPAIREITIEDLEGNK